MFFGSAFLVFGIGGLCVLVCRLAVDALPAFAGCTAGFWAYDTGAGPIGAIIVALVAGAMTLAAGRLVFDSTRNGAVRVLVALLFAAPAALAGYHVRAWSGALCDAVRWLAACVRRNGRSHYWTDRNGTASRPGVRILRARARPLTAQAVDSTQ